MAVKNTHADYKAMAPQWQKCRAVIAGEREVKAAQELFLPKLRKQAQIDYNDYLQRATLFAATGRTLAGFIGMLFRKPPIVQVPAGIEPYLDNITQAGVPFNLFLRQISKEIIATGRVGIMADYPQRDPSKVVTVAEAEAGGYRPSLQLYTAETVLNWRVTTIANRAVLTLVVLQEEIEHIKDEFTVERKEQYRVLDLFNGVYRQRLFIVDKGKDVQIGADIFPLMNGKVMNYIPFVFCCADNNTPAVDEPPLIALVDLNLKHYLVSADYEHACHFTALPTPYATGYTKESDDETIAIGSQSFLLFPNPETQVGYLEFSGGGIGALQANLDGKEKQMAVLGARMLEQQQRQVESAETAGIHRSGEHATLASISGSIGQSVGIALKWLAEWAGAAGDVSVKVNSDFAPAAFDPIALNGLVGAWQKGAISAETLFENLQRVEVIDETDTFEDEQAKIALDDQNRAAKAAAALQPSQQPKAP